MKTKVYFSQPMHGKDKETILKEREGAVKHFEEQGFEVINNVFDLEPDKKPLYYLIKSLEMMQDAEVVYFFPGWEFARGCRIEHQVALSYGKFVCEVNDDGRQRKGN